MKMGIFRFLALVVFACLFPTGSAKAQTLGEMLRAVQKRQQLLSERDQVTAKLTIQEYTDQGRSSIPSDLTAAANSTPILIQWNGLTDSFPSDAKVNGLSADAQMGLLKQAGDEIDRLAPSFYDQRLLQDGILAPVRFDTRIFNIDRGSVSLVLRVLANRTLRMKILSWPMEDVKNAYLYRTNSWDCPKDVGGGSITYTASTYGMGSEISLTFGIECTVTGPDQIGGPYSFFSGPDGTTTAINVMGPDSIQGNFQIVTAFDYYGLAMTVPNPQSGKGVSDPGCHLWFDLKAPIQITTVNPRGILSGDFDGILVNNTWGSGWGNFSLPNIPSDLVDDNEIEWLKFETLFAANFAANGPEFAQVNQVPERPPAIRLTPAFDHGELKVRLAGKPENECELVWEFPSSVYLDTAAKRYPTGALAARNILSARGSGDWDAVYSGKAGDREDMVQWPDVSTAAYKRWEDFNGYLREYWRPVLKQLVCATYAVNIIQTNRYKYEIDFYRRNQVGDKDPATGEYTFPPATSAVDKFMVSNPDADDSHAGVLQILVHQGQANEATYNLTLSQVLDGAGNLSPSTWTFTGPFLNQTLVTQAATYHDDGSINTPYKVIDDTTLDGVVQPEVTTTYWDTVANLEKIDQVVETSGADGTRTTTYTYDWPKDSNGVSQIGNLTQIQQTGGPNPYTASYDSAGQLTSYSDKWGSEDVSYSGHTVTRTQKINGQPVRTLVTTYSGDMSTATTTAQ